MLATGSGRAAYLALDELAPNPILARRLPADLARRFHALPLAEDNGRITVVMADPKDAVAREAVVSALGSAPCMVQGDLLAIDALLAEVWGGGTNHALDLLLCDSPSPLPDAVQDYALAFGGLLEAPVSRLSRSGDMDTLACESDSVDRDLIIFGEREHPLVHRLLSRQVERPLEDQVAAERQQTTPFAVLVAQKPRWPLKRILLVHCGERGDSAALDWVLPLSRQSGSAVTVLAVVPQVPALCGQRAGMDQGIAALLTSQTPLGRNIKQVTRNLVDWEIECTLRLRQGPRDWQIRCEVMDGEYDLIVLADPPYRCGRRWLEGDLASAVLRLTNRPLLVAKSVLA